MGQLLCFGESSTAESSIEQYDFRRIKLYALKPAYVSDNP